MKSSLNQKSKINKPNQSPQTIPESLQTSKHTQFEDTSNTIHINSFETYVDFSLELPLFNTEAYRKQIQLLYKTIYEVDRMALIVKYKLEEDEEEITEKNEVGVGVQVKNTWVNCTEAILKHL